MGYYKSPKTLILSTLLAFAPLSLMAQELRVTGKVLMASDSTAITGATIKLRDSQAATIVGQASGEDGTFVLQGDSKRVADLHITFVGMKPVTIGIKGAEQATINLGNIYLQSDETQLNELVVQRDLRQIDREIIFPQKHLVQSSPDVLQLLANLALSGLNVDLVHHTANIRGKEIYWMIDGVPKTLADVRQLNPKAILRFEYSDLPSIRLIDKGQGGYINVILKEQTDGGSIHTHLNSALWVGFAEAQVSGNYHEGKSDFTIDYSGSYRDYPRWRRDVSQAFNHPDGVIKREEKGAERSPMFLLNHNLNLTYIFRHDPRNLLSITWRNGFGRQSYDIRSEMLETGQVTYNRRSFSQYKGYVPALDAYYKYIFEKGGSIEVNLVGTLTMGENVRDLTDKRGEELLNAIANPIKNRYYSLVGEVNYQKLLHPKVYLTLGLQNSYGRATNLYLSNDYRDQLDRNNTYLYGQISGRLSDKLQYSLGTGVKVLYTADKESRRTYVRNQSSVALYYSPTNEWSFALNSYFTPHLPALSQLSPVSQRFDDLTIYTGNPQLRPGTGLNNRLTTSFRKGKFSANLDLAYNHTFNPLYTHISYSPEERAFVNQPRNGHFNSQVGAGLNVAVSQLFDFLTIVGNVGYNHFRSDVGANPLALRDFYWDLSVQLNYKRFTLAGYYMDSPASLYNETVTRPGAKTGATLIWSGDKVTLYAQMLYVGLPKGDLYHTQNFSKATPYTQVIAIPENGNMLTLGLVWDFSFGKKGKRLNRGLYNYDRDNSMVKVQE